MNRRFFRYLSLCLSLAVFLAFGVAAANVPSSPKGQWGKVVPIADNNHPNLYYNQSEIDELRHMVLVQHRPALLWDLWNKSVSGALAVGPSAAGNLRGEENIKAALSFMLEPTDAKADAIRFALLDFMKTFPKGGGSTGDVWFNSTDWNYSGYSVPWLFDLLMAYHPQKLSASQVSALKHWFHLTASVGHTDNWNIKASDRPKLLNREGKTVAGYANWWARYFGNGFAAALMSGNQEDVDYWFDSGWPHDKFYYDGSWTPAPGQHQFDMVMYLLTVFPSGANEDTYNREGFRLPENDWSTNSYSHGIYHFAAMYGPILAAEAAYHNGMTRVYEITDAGSEPALLRTFKRAIASRKEVDRVECWRKYPGSGGCSGPNPGHPIVGWDPIIFAGYRRYSDPMIDAAVRDLPDGSKFIWDPGVPAGNDISRELSPFFGYPRRTVWPRGSALSP
jgi:hypothetical protein